VNSEVKVVGLLASYDGDRFVTAMTWFSLGINQLLI
jgi:hypothetical protein